MLTSLFRQYVSERLSHGYCAIGLIRNAMRAVPSHPMAHLPWISLTNVLPNVIKHIKLFHVKQVEKLFSKSLIMVLTIEVLIKVKLHTRTTTISLSAKQNYTEY